MVNPVGPRNDQDLREAVGLINRARYLQSGTNDHLQNYCQESCQETTELLSRDHGTLAKNPANRL